MECARPPTLLPAPGPSLRPSSPLLPTLVPLPRLAAGACRPWWLLHGQTLPGKPGLGSRAPVSPLLAAPSFPLSALLASPGGAHIQLPGASLVQNSVTLSKGLPASVPSPEHTEEQPCPGKQSGHVTLWLHPLTPVFAVFSRSCFSTSPPWSCTPVPEAPFAPITALYVLALPLLQLFP